MALNISFSLADFKTRLVENIEAASGKKPSLNAGMDYYAENKQHPILPTDGLAHQLSPHAKKEEFATRFNETKSSEHQLRLEFALKATPAARAALQKTAAPRLAPTA